MTPKNQEETIGQKLEKKKKEEEKKRIASISADAIPFDYLKFQKEARKLHSKKKLIAFWNAVGMLSIMLWGIFILGGLILITVYFGNRKKLITNLTSHLSSFYTEINFNKASNNLFFEDEFSNFEIPFPKNPDLWKNDKFLLTSNYGLLPKRNVNIPVYQAYQNKVTKTSKPKISFIINNLGLSERITIWALSLPAEITLSFSPYSEQLDKYIPIARTIGHEVLLSFPIVNLDKGDTGNLSLSLEKNNLQTTKVELSKFLARTTGYVGLNANFQNANYTLNNLKFLINDLKKRGLILVSKDQLTSNSKRHINKFFANKNYFSESNETINKALDEKQLNAFFQSAFKQLDRRNQNNPLVVNLEPFPNVISYLNKLFSQNSDFNEKYQLVPVSYRFNP